MGNGKETNRKETRPASRRSKEARVKVQVLPENKERQQAEVEARHGMVASLPWKRKWKQQVLHDEGDRDQAAPLSTAKHIAPPHEGEPERQEGDIVSVANSEGQWKVNAARCMDASTRQALRNKSMMIHQSQVLKSYGFEKRLKEITENHRQRNGSNCGAQRVCL